MLGREPVTRLASYAAMAIGVKIGSTIAASAGNGAVVIVGGTVETIATNAVSQGSGTFLF
jgi:hypothetical protein